MCSGAGDAVFAAAGFVTGPSAGSTESYGVITTRQMSMMIFSRETALYEVLGSVPNRLFIMELSLGRHVLPPSQAKKSCIPVPGSWS